jgi:hypothetical protein
MLALPSGLRKNGLVKRIVMTGGFPPGLELYQRGTETHAALRNWPAGDGVFGLVGRHKSLRFTALTGRVLPAPIRHPARSQTTLRYNADSRALAMLIGFLPAPGKPINTRP